MILQRYLGSFTTKKTQKLSLACEKFFELCDFFNISPEEFFRYNDEDPKWTDQTFKRLQNLNEEERKIIDYILTTFENNKK